MYCLKVIIFDIMMVKILLKRKYTGVMRVTLINF